MKSWDLVLVSPSYTHLTVTVWREIHVLSTYFFFLVGVVSSTRL